jgi:hypothetical protein
LTLIDPRLVLPYRRSFFGFSLYSLSSYPTSFVFAVVNGLW